MRYDQHWLRPRPGVTRRIVAVVAAVDLLFSIVTSFAYVRLMQLVLPASEPALWPFIAVYAGKLLILVVTVTVVVRPVERWQRAPLGTAERDALLPRTYVAGYRAPVLFAAVFAPAWGAKFLTVTAALSGAVLTRGPGSLAVVLFSTALLLGAAPLDYSLLGKLLAPAASVLSVEALERGIDLGGHPAHFRTRLALTTLALGLTPAVWMASIAVAPAARLREAPEGFGYTVLLFALVVVVWILVVAWFQAGAVSDPLAEIAETVAHLTHQPDLASIRPVPVFSRDEIGGLAQSVNHMVARLAESRHKIEELATTAQRRAAELETVLGNMVDAVVVSDMRGRLIGANRAGLRLFGLRSTEELGADVRELFDRLPATHADGRKLSPDELPITRGLAGQPVHASDVVVLQQQGERPRQLSWSSSPIRDDDGRVLGVVAVIRDVTELVELDQLKDQFIRAAAHELKTPVTIMKARAQGLLRGAEVDPRRRKMLESIDRGADRIAHIVRDLLELSEMQLGRLSIVPERVDLRAVIEDGVAHAARLSAGERIHVHADGGAIVDGDRTRLAGVIGRLLENAAKYSPNGGEIDVDLHLENGRAVVSVTDHGIGIPQEKQAHLFECFYRAHAATQEDFGGLGVGLFLSRKIVDLHHGSMWFKSEQGHGSTFAFSLPLHAESTPAQ